MHKLRGVNSQQLVLMQPAQPKGACGPQEILPEACSQVRAVMDRGSIVCCSGQVKILLSPLLFFDGLFLFYFMFSIFSKNVQDSHQKSLGLG